MIEHRHLRYFVTAARLLHVTRAAETLHIAQPALTQNIRQLEEELGVELFHRIKKRISLTDAGQAFLLEAERILRQLDYAIVATQKAARGELGKLALGFISTAGLVLVPQLVSAFRKRHPGPTIALHELLSAEVETAVRNGTVDAGIMYGPYPEGEFSVRQLETDHLVLALPPNHRLTRRDVVNLRDLADDYFIVPGIETAGTMVDAVLTECGQAGFRPQTGHELTTATLQTTLGLVSAGLGVSLVPSKVQRLARKGVAFRPLREHHASLRLDLLWRPQNTSAVLRNLLECLPEMEGTQ